MWDAPSTQGQRVTMVPAVLDEAGIQLAWGGQCPVCLSPASPSPWPELVGLHFWKEDNSPFYSISSLHRHSTEVPVYSSPVGLSDMAWEWSRA